MEKRSGKAENIAITSLENNLEEKPPVVEDEPANLRALCVRFGWKCLKSLVFVVCVALFFQQTAEFYILYKTYPTATNIMVTYPKFLKTPAITVCNRNLINKTEFCVLNDEYCMKPRNIERLCERHPNVCMGNISEITIPMLGYHTMESGYLNPYTRGLGQKFLFDTDPKKSYPFETPFREWKTTYVYDMNMNSHARCHSENLHIFSEEELQNTTFRSVAELHYSTANSLYELQMVKISTLKIKMMEEKESFYLWADSQVYLSIHSPVVPSNPFMHGKPLRTGYIYDVYVRLEEEHLLPPPYPTNCVDYDTIWRKNNKTGPRSQEMCRELCHREYYKSFLYCETSMTMYENPHHICTQSRYHIVPDTSKEALHLCLKMQRKLLPSDLSRMRTEIKVNIFVQDRSVTVVSHKPLYGEGIPIKDMPCDKMNWEMFSYVGGLMGCWLGISVWAFIGIIERNYTRALQLMKKFRDKKSKV
ncbi:uncharacterized protein CEXT_54411 [Caerostris extrusa]|uniref:Uncharacterized protein n=1 Tax=Caerostris extrusa TaxID=172846 RepID=A0AAV4QJH6_CAEEX|nr:uncharacterized protein CEXT_54411 [Caerostris extrusa]